MTSCAGATCYPITYQYDPKTLRMTGYSAALNGGTVSGTLTWNPNGSLQKLVIADAFNSADAQSCTYGADDLSRIASVNCLSGSTNVWNQNFTYDAFGNITKQVPTNGTGISWIPGYNASTNRYTLGGTTYDANGNVTNDTFNTYTWDAEGKLLSEEGYTFIYDAFGHEAEWLSGGTYELSYITIGNYKLSATGQTPFYAEYPYPGGSLTSEGGGLTAAQMADWLGTSRAIYSYSGGNWIKSIAHAPFGETYVGNSQNFTGQWSDADTTNTTYFFPERQYRSSQGRWLSPDPAGTAAVDPSNPQSWNRYAYVLNNPLAAIDPDGLWCVWDDGTHDDDPNNDGNATQYDCASQGGRWDPFDIVNGCDDNTGTCTLNDGSKASICGNGICYGSNTATVTAAPPDDVATIRADLSGCIAQGLQATGKELIGYDIVTYGVGKVDNWAMAHSSYPVISPNAANPFGPSMSVSPPSPTDIAIAAGSVHALEIGADSLHESAGAQQAIKVALRSEGLKVSKKAVGKVVANGGKILGRFGIALAGYTFIESVRGCMGD
jgi:RHS repeat-associated protein